MDIEHHGGGSHVTPLLHQSQALFKGYHSRKGRIGLNFWPCEAGSISLETSSPTGEGGLVDHLFKPKVL